MANRSPFSIAIGVISLIVRLMLSPGITISVPSGSVFATYGTGTEKPLIYIDSSDKKATAMAADELRWIGLVSFNGGPDVTVKEIIVDPVRAAEIHALNLFHQRLLVPLW